MDLLELMHKCQTDKAGHRFDLPYGALFEHHRHTVQKVLEIGIKNGGSLRLWERYFPNAQIVGIDVRKTSARHASDRSKVFIGNAYRPEFLASVLEQVGGDFDLIVDDGSHFSDDQVMAIQTLWPALRVGGIFAIEDTHAHVKYARYRRKPTKYPALCDMIVQRIRRRLRSDRAIANSPGICIYGGIILFLKNGDGPPPMFLDHLEARQKKRLRAARLKLLAQSRKKKK